MKVTVMKWVAERYDRTDSGKSWRSKPYEVTTSYLTQDRYRRITSEEELRFWRSLGSCRVEYGYMSIGYCIDRLTRVSPSKEEKIVEKFYVRNLEFKNVGNRERNVLMNLDSINIVEDTEDHIVWRFADKAGNACEYDFVTCRFVG